MRPVNVSSLTNPRDVDQAPAPAHSSRRQQNNRPSTKMTGRAPSLLSITGPNQFNSVIFTFPNDYLVEFLLPPMTTTPTLEAVTSSPASSSSSSVLSTPSSMTAPTMAKFSLKRSLTYAGITGSQS